MREPRMGFLEIRVRGDKASQNTEDHTLILAMGISYTSGVLFTAMARYGGQNQKIYFRELDSVFTRIVLK